MDLSRRRPESSYLSLKWFELTTNYGLVLSPLPASPRQRHFEPPHVSERQPPHYRQRPTSRSQFMWDDAVQMIGAKGDLWPAPARDLFPPLKFATLYLRPADARHALREDRQIHLNQRAHGNLSRDHGHPPLMLYITSTPGTADPYPALRIACFHNEIRS